MADTSGLVDLAKNAKGVPQVLLATWGVYGGQYADKFAEPYKPLASMICLTAMVVGGCLMTFVAVRATLFPSAT